MHRYSNPATGVAALHATDWATQALNQCGLLHVFNPFSRGTHYFISCKSK